LSFVDLPPEVRGLFEVSHDYVQATHPDPREAEHLAPRAILCAPGGARIDAAYLDRLPGSAKAVATYSVGHDHIDLDACRDRGLAVFSTPGVLAESVADAAMLLVLGAARRATESIALIREGRWMGWTPTQLVGLELSGRTLGILGMGGIGSRIARRARAFGMVVAYCNRRPIADEADSRFVADPHALFAESDVFMLACPSTAETRKFVSATLLTRARPSLILVNVGRGDLVDDDALIAALSDGRIFAAGLDVFDGEPKVDPRYFALPNLFMLPHIGSSTIEARMGMGTAIVTALSDWDAGGAPPNRLV
jgi:glyoxylate reductase